MTNGAFAWRVLGAPVVMTWGALLCACGSDETEVVTPYEPGSATIIGEQAGGEAIVTLSGCNDGACTEAVEQCGADGAADVIVDDAGNVVEVICYGQDVAVEQIPAEQVDTYSTDQKNDTVLVLDGADDGVDVEGDVVVDGNNAVIYGEGPDVSVVSGTLQLEMNNAKIRGVRIQGDVIIDKNDTKLLYCVIEGDLTIIGNNTTVAECQVFGRVQITGLNTVFVRNGCEGAERLDGFNLTCNGNTSFADANDDFVVQDAELGAELECFEKEGSPEPQG